MPRRLSRGEVARHVAGRIMAGDRTVITQLGAYLIERRQTNQLALYVRDIEDQLAQAGYVKATVRTAFGLSEASLRRVRTYIKSQTSARQIEVDERVEPDLLGGVMVELPGRKLDATVRRQLTALRTAYKKV